MPPAATTGPLHRHVAAGTAAALSLVALLTAGAAAGARPSAAPLSSRLDAALTHFAAAHPTFPGVAVAIKTPVFEWSGAEGLADRAGHRPLTPDTPFRIASVTKTFTAAAILRLVEEGKLGLEDPIARRLSPSTVAALRRGGYDAGAIRVRELLQHTSGLYDYAEDQAFQTFVVGHPRHRWTRAEQVRFALAHGKPLGPPGAAFHYSDTGYILLGEILERRTGQNLGGAYRSLLGFDRLGLGRTYLETLEPAPPREPSRAHQYLGTIDTTGFDPSFDLYGGGGLVSTVGDLARFYEALLAGRVYARAATLRTMLGNPTSRRLADLGMGIFPESIGRQTCWHHDGFWGTTVLRCPQLRATIAITVNQAADFDAPVQRLEAELLRLLARS